MLNFRLIIIFSGFISFIFNRIYFLNSLLRLELISLGGFFLIFCLFSYAQINYFFMLIFLTILVCEGCLGLSLLVAIVNFIGRDIFKNIFLLRP